MQYDANRLVVQKIGEHSSRKLTLTQDRMKQNKANMHVGSSVQLWALLDTNVILLPLLLVTFDLSRLRPPSDELHLLVHGLPLDAEVRHQLFDITTTAFSD